jgi:FkbM family methyltransferase
MIIYTSTSEDCKTFYYKFEGNSPTEFKIKIHNTETHLLQHTGNILLNPGGSYYTSLPNNWKGRKASFYRVDNNELITSFFIEGKSFINDSVLCNYTYHLSHVLNDLHQISLQGTIDEIYLHKNYRDVAVKGGIVVDIGFNYGLFSLRSLNMGASKVYGFEPNKNIFNTIHQLFPYRDKTQLFEFAVGKESKIVKFFEDSGTLGSTIENYYKNTDTHYLKPDMIEQTYDVQLINFNDQVKKLQIQQIDLLKIDCEGAEYDIIESINPEYLSNNIKNIILEYHENGGPQLKTITDKLSKNGFIYEIYGGTESSKMGMLWATK